MKSLVLFCLFASSITFGHEFHIAIAKVNYNEKAKILEATIQVEAHDIEDWLTEKGIAVGHIEHISKRPSLQDSVYQEILKNFAAKIEGKQVDFTVIGIEVENDGRAFIYLKSSKIKLFDTIEWTFSILMDHNEKQQNKLELTVGEKKHYATFLHHERTQTMQLNKP